ncbi:hypothetical protein [Algoriphagus sediminis]|uniref:Uncharacterized protein n=1 Tax=Algoriphagus sediminis TaxID=3057113 RepID=A0ABT7YAW2_9BACT|nr:hypothetical protein [Algoriphagus sediminis]MDN3203662.1 hypothetical protein [Algoriphagus sediminis]
MKSQEEVKALLIPILEKHGECFQKFLCIKAKSAVPGEEVITRTADGVETVNLAEQGDWLVENQTKAKERYLVPDKIFQDKYELQESNGEWKKFKPKGKIIGIVYDKSLFHNNDFQEELVFEAPWGEKMRLRKGDYLVCPPDKTEVYRIAKKEFEETYKPC